MDDVLEFEDIDDSDSDKDYVLSMYEVRWVSLWLSVLTPRMTNFSLPVKKLAILHIFHLQYPYLRPRSY